MNTETDPLVLCVDDEAPVLGAVRRVMEPEPVHLVTMNDPNEALRFLRHRPVSLLIADERMPDMSGTDLLRQVGLVAPGTPSILMTAYPDAVAAVRLGRLGVRRLLLKPWDDDDLREAVREALTTGTPAESTVYDDPARGFREVVLKVDCAGRSLTSVLAAIEATTRRDEVSSAGVCVVLEDFVGPLDLLVHEQGRLASNCRVRVAGIGVLAPRQANRRVLVVARDSQEAEVIEVVLKGCGHRPEAAASGLHAIRRLDEARFDAVLVDVEFGADDAYAIMDGLMSHPAGVPIVLIAEAEDPWQGMMFPHLSVRACLGRPFSSRELCAAVDEATAP